MFQNIPSIVRNRMDELEKADAEDRQNDTPKLKRLRQIPPESGKILTILAASAPEGEFVEIGTSAGYSTLWIILACRYLGKTVKTYEILPEKIKLAKETFSLARVSSYVELISGDARDYLKDEKNISFCFLDSEKEYYAECYELVIPNLVKGGLFIADNCVSHEKDLKPFLKNTFADSRVDSLILPIGKGLLLSRKF